MVGQGLERVGEALANVCKLVGDTADGLDERLGEEYGDYARRAASAIDDAANSLASKDADELIDDTREFVRKSPGIALAGAAVVGFALARLIKTGPRPATSDDEELGLMLKRADPSGRARTTPIGEMVAQLVDEGKAYAQAEVDLVKATRRGQGRRCQVPPCSAAPRCLFLHAAVVVLAWPWCSAWRR